MRFHPSKNSMMIARCIIGSGSSGSSSSIVSSAAVVIIAIAGVGSSRIDTMTIRSAGSRIGTFCRSIVFTITITIGSIAAIFRIVGGIGVSILQPSGPSLFFLQEFLVLALFEG